MHKNTCTLVESFHPIFPCKENLAIKKFFNYPTFYVFNLPTDSSLSFCQSNVYNRIGCGSFIDKTATQTEADVRIKDKHYKKNIVLVLQENIEL